MQAKEIVCPNCGYYRTRLVSDLRRRPMRPRRFIDLAFWPIPMPLRGRYTEVKAGDDLICIHCRHRWQQQEAGQPAAG